MAEFINIHQTALRPDKNTIYNRNVRDKYTTVVLQHFQTSEYNLYMALEQQTLIEPIISLFINGAKFGPGITS